MVCRQTFENFGQFQSVQNSITSSHIIYGWNHHEILFNPMSSNFQIGKVSTADIPVETGGQTMERAKNSSNRETDATVVSGASTLLKMVPSLRRFGRRKHEF